MMENGINTNVKDKQQAVAINMSELPPSLRMTNASLLRKENYLE